MKLTKFIFLLPVIKFLIYNELFKCFSCSYFSFERVFKTSNPHRLLKLIFRSESANYPIKMNKLNYPGYTEAVTVIIKSHTANGTTYAGL